MHKARNNGTRAGRPSVPLLLLGLLLVIVVLRLAREIVIPISVAVLLTFILAPVVTLLRRHGFGRASAVIFTVVCAFALLGAAATIVTFEFRGLANELPNYRQNIRKKISDLRLVSKRGSIQKVQETVRVVMDEINKPEPNATNGPPVPVVVAGKTTGSAAAPLLVPLLSKLATAGLVVALVIFMLFQREDLRDRLLRIAGYGRLAVNTKAVDEAGKLVSSYLLRQCLINSAFGAGLAAGLYLIGLPYAVLWGFLAAIGRFVPYLGPTLGAGAPVILSLAVFDSWTAPLLVIGLATVLELVNNLLLEPLVYGKTIGVSQVALLIMIAFWTWLWGPIGLVLATPITVCVMVISRNIPSLEFISLLLGSEPALAPHQVFYQRLVARDVGEAEGISKAFGQDHSRAEFFEQLLIPVLATCRHDRNRHRITEADQKFIFETLRGLIEVPETSPAETPQEAAGSLRHRGLLPGGDHPERPSLLGFPGGDEADELALMMLAELLGAEDWRMQVLSSEMLCSEMLAALAQENSAVACVCVLPEGPLLPARQLCKAVRSNYPRLPIVVARWALAQPVPGQTVRALEGLTDAIGYTLAETKNQVIQFAQLQPGPPVANQSMPVSARH